MSTKDKKRCYRCRQYRSIKTGYYRKANGALRTECKRCIIERNSPKTESARKAKSKYMKAWRAKNADSYNAQRAGYREANREKIRARHSEWHRMFPERKMFNQAKTRAKKNGLDFTIELSDLLPLPSKCPVLGIPVRKGKFAQDDNAYSIDRIDNSKGYTPDNIAVISRRANVLKRDATLEELQSLARWARKQVRR